MNRRVVIPAALLLLGAAGVALVITGLDTGEKVFSIVGVLATLASLLIGSRGAAGTAGRETAAGTAGRETAAKYNVQVSRSWFVSVGDRIRDR